MGFNMIYWLIIAKRCLKSKHPLNNFLFTMNVIHYFLQPSIVSELSKSFICTYIDNKAYLKAALDLSCEDFQYKKWVILFFISILIKIIQIFLDLHYSTIFALLDCCISWVLLAFPCYLSIKIRTFSFQIPLRILLSWIQEGFFLLGIRNYLSKNNHDSFIDIENFNLDEVSFVVVCDFLRILPSYKQKSFSRPSSE